MFSPKELIDILDVQADFNRKNADFDTIGDGWNTAEEYLDSAMAELVESYLAGRLDDIELVGWIEDFAGRLERAAKKLREQGAMDSPV